MVWNASNPASSGALVSQDIRDNWNALEGLLGTTVPSSTVALALPRQPGFLPGSAAAVTVYARGVLRNSIDLNSRANSTNVATTLTTYALAANSLTSDTRFAEIRLHGSFAANANAKTLVVLFGGTTITMGSANFNSGGWRALIELQHTGTTAQKYVSTLWTNADLASRVVVSSTIGENLGAATTIKTVVTGSATNDILQESFRIEIV